MKTDFTSVVTIDENGRAVVDLATILTIIKEIKIQTNLYPGAKGIFTESKDIQNKIYQVVKEACEYISMRIKSKEAIFVAPVISNLSRMIVHDKIRFSKEMLDKMFLGTIHDFLQTVHVNLKLFYKTEPNYKTIKEKEDRLTEIVRAACEDTAVNFDLAVIIKLVTELKKIKP